MPGRKQRKEIDAVVRKYLGYSRRALLKASGAVYGTIAAIGVGLDLLTTGGLFSVGTFVFGGMGAAGAALSSADTLHENRKKARTNAAGQSFECSADIHEALQKMESLLRASFAKAAAPAGFGKHKEEFLQLAAEIGQDAQKLSPAFKIVSGAPQDKYEFTLDTAKRTTLAQACDGVKQALAQKKQTLLEKKMEDINAIIHDLENTEIIKRKQNPRP